MTLSVSDYRAKIAACATKATTLMNPVIKGAKEAVPEMWFGSAEEAAIKHLLAGAILVWDGSGEKKFGHVPTTSRLSGATRTGTRCGL